MEEMHAIVLQQKLFELTLNVDQITFTKFLYLSANYKPGWARNKKVNHWKKN